MEREQKTYEEREERPTETVVPHSAKITLRNGPAARRGDTSREMCVWGRDWGISAFGLPVTYTVLYKQLESIEEEII